MAPPGAMALMQGTFSPATNTFIPASPHIYSYLLTSSSPLPRRLVKGLGVPGPVALLTEMGVEVSMSSRSALRS